VIRRREFITLLGSGAATWPIAARAQQRGRMQRVGVLVPYAVSDPEGQSRVTSFQRGLKELGWTEGGNVQIEVRWTAGDADRMRVYATELVALSPDVIMAIGLTPVLALRQASHTVPIVFTAVADPVSGGVVESLARPGGNTTGFSNMEFGTAAKWLELLKEIAPHVMRVAIVRENIPTGIGLFAVIQERAPSFGIEAIPSQSQFKMLVRLSAESRRLRARRMLA